MRSGSLKGVRLWFARNNGALFALVLFIAMFALYVAKNGVGVRTGLITAVANKGVLLALVAMAQTLPILTSGLDLSVGMIFVLTNCIASTILSGPPWLVAAGVAAVLLSGVICGAINGALVVYGRLQPIIATLATGAVYNGLALLVRPVPGGSIEPTFAAVLTTQIFDVVPTTLVILLAVVLGHLVAVPAVDHRARLLRDRIVGISGLHDRHSGPPFATCCVHVRRAAGRHWWPAADRHDAVGRRQRG